MTSWRRGDARAHLCRKRLSWSLCWWLIKTVTVFMLSMRLRARVSVFVWLCRGWFSFYSDIKILPLCSERRGSFELLEQFQILRVVNECACRARLLNVAVVIRRRFPQGLTVFAWIKSRLKVYDLWQLCSVYSILYRRMYDAYLCTRYHVAAGSSGYVSCTLIEVTTVKI